jgi:DNA polymerase III epsilon subunit-like protein
VSDAQESAQTHRQPRDRRADAFLRHTKATVWAQSMRRPGAAVILDTETTSLEGYIVEIAILDSYKGRILLNTLINPGCPVQPDAYAVHGITDAELADAPPLAMVLPRLLHLTTDRTVITYNSRFDYDTLMRHAHRDRLDPAHLADLNRWNCLMNRRRDWEQSDTLIALRGNHRAADDCKTAYSVLKAMTRQAVSRTSSER